MKNKKVIKMNTLKIISYLAFVAMATACNVSSYDNYDAPESEFTGNIVYEQEPIPVSYNNVTFELWQSGFGEETPINVTVGQDGSFSAKLFDGDYRLIFPQGQGPFQTLSDTVHVSVQGNENLDVEVLPYYMIRNEGFSNSGNSVSASIALEQIISEEEGGQAIEHVSLYISKTQYVDQRTSESTHTIDGGDIGNINSIQLNVDVPDFTPTQDYVFARVGVKISNVEDMIFSGVHELQLN